MVCAGWNSYLILLVFSILFSVLPLISVSSFLRTSSNRFTRENKCVLCERPSNLRRFCREVEGQYTCIFVCQRCVNNLRKYQNKIIHTKQGFWVWWDQEIKFEISWKKAFLEFDPQNRFQGKFDHYWVIERGKPKFRKIYGR